MEIVLKIKEGWLHLPKSIQDKFNLNQNGEIILIDESDHLILKSITSKSQHDNYRTKIQQNLESILNLQPNWDENNALNFSPEHIQNVQNILIEIENEYQKLFQQSIPLPGILPVADNSIDVHWIRNNKYDILLNIPGDGEGEISFSCNIAEKYRSSSLCNSIEISRVIIPWLRMALTQ